MWSSECNKHVVFPISFPVSNVELAFLPITGLKYVLIEDVLVWNYGKVWQFWRVECRANFVGYKRKLQPRDK